MNLNVLPPVSAQWNARVAALGRREFERFRKEIGIEVAPFEKPCVQSLGVGAALTEFAVSSVPVTAEGLSAVTGLGARAILMVSLFDSALDRGLPVPSLSPVDAAVRCSDNAGDSHPLIHRAVNLYLDRLAALPRNRPHLKHLVQRAIERMYAAELESAAGPKIPRRSWWRKNVLPVVILGVPAWIFADACPPRQFRRHLAWLCRLGEFLGWLDDCVDYHDDLQYRHANRIDSRLRSMSRFQLVRNIAGQANRLLSEWDVANPTAPMRDYFAVLVWGWIDQKTKHALL